jgi:hypothetical protein
MDVPSDRGGIPSKWDGTVAFSYAGFLPVAICELGVELLGAIRLYSILWIERTKVCRFRVFPVENLH